MRFAKYHGLGNDFLLFDEKDGVTPAEFTSERVRSLCHRQTGVGADGILLRTKSDKATHKMWLWNADGSSAEISGNGLRCFVLFLEDRGYEVAKEFEVETGGGVLKGVLVTMSSKRRCPFRILRGPARRRCSSSRRLIRHLTCSL